MQNIFIVQLRKLNSNDPYQLVGVYSNKKLADAAGESAVDLRPNSHYTVTIKPLDDIID